MAHTLSRMLCVCVCLQFKHWIVDNTYVALMIGTWTRLSPFLQPTSCNKTLKNSLQKERTTERTTLWYYYRAKTRKKTVAIKLIGKRHKNGDKSESPTPAHGSLRNLTLGLTLLTFDCMTTSTPRSERGNRRPQAFLTCWLKDLAAVNMTWLLMAVKDTHGLPFFGMLGETLSYIGSPDQNSSARAVRAVSSVLHRGVAIYP